MHRWWDIYKYFQFKTSSSSCIIVLGLDAIMYVFLFQGKEIIAEIVRTNIKYKIIICINILNQLFLIIIGTPAISKRGP